MIVCSLVLTLMGIYLYIRGREEDDRDAAFTGPPCFSPAWPAFCWAFCGRSGNRLPALKRKWAFSSDGRAAGS